jgi:hypothetical protein
MGGEHLCFRVFVSARGVKTVGPACCCQTDSS